MSERESEGETEANSDRFSMDEASATDEEEIKIDKPEVEPKLSVEMREKLCLRAESDDSDIVALHPVLIKEWMNWTRKGLWEGEEDDEKKREEKEDKQREEIMKKFPRKGDFYVEAPNLIRRSSFICREQQKAGINILLPLKMQ